MLKPAMVFTYLLIPAAVILLSGRSPLAIRFLWAIGSFASGLLLLAASLLTPFISDTWMPASVGGAVGLVLLFACPLVPWGVFVCFRRATLHAATKAQ